MRKGEVGGGIWSEESVQVLILGNSKYEVVVSVNVGKYGCYGRHCVREESWLGLMVASRVSPTNDDPAVSAGVLTQAAPTWAWYSSSSLSLTAVAGLDSACCHSCSRGSADPSSCTSTLTPARLSTTSTSLTLHLWSQSTIIGRKTEPNIYFLLH